MQKSTLLRSWLQQCTAKPPGLHNCASYQLTVTSSLINCKHRAFWQNSGGNLGLVASAAVFPVSKQQQQLGEQIPPWLSGDACLQDVCQDLPVHPKDQDHLHYLRRQLDGKGNELTQSIRSSRSSSSRQQDSPAGALQELPKRGRGRPRKAASASFLTSKGASSKHTKKSGQSSNSSPENTSYSSSSCCSSSDILSSSSSTTSSPLKEPPTISSTKGKKLGRSRSSDGPTPARATLVTSTKRQIQQLYKQQQEDHSTAQQKIKGHKRVSNAKIHSPTPEHELRGGNSTRAKLLTREEEGMLTTVVRDGLHIELVAKKLGSILRRLPSDDELATALKVKPEEVKHRMRASHAARQCLLSANHRLVIKVVTHFIATQKRRGGSSLSFSDSMEAGLHGLQKAIVKFEPESGNKLSTYAVNWIKQELHRALVQTDLLRVPEYCASEASLLVRMRANLQSQHNRVPTEEELMEALGWSAKKLGKVNHAMQVKQAAAQALSFESSFMGDDGTSGLDAKMSIAHSQPGREEGWKFSTGSNGAVADQEEQLVKDLEALLQEAMYTPGQTAANAERAGSVLGQSLQQQQQQQLSGIATDGAASSLLTGNRSCSLRGRKMTVAAAGPMDHEGGRGVSGADNKVLSQPGMCQGDAGRHTAADTMYGLASSEAARRSSIQPRMAGGMEHGGALVLTPGHEQHEGMVHSTQQEDCLSPFHLEILRLWLGLEGSRSQMWGAEEGLQELTSSKVHPSKYAHVAAANQKQERAQALLEQQAQRSKPSSVSSIASRFKMTPRQVRRTIEEALVWLREQRKDQVAEILRAYSVEPDRAAGILPRTGSGADKKS